MYDRAEMPILGPRLRAPERQAAPLRRIGPGDADLLVGRLGNGEVPDPQDVPGACALGPPRRPTRPGHRRSRGYRQWPGVRTAASLPLLPDDANEGSGATTCYPFQLEQGAHPGR